MQKAFPEAEGYGAQTKGGRGGRVFQVTNLNDSGLGSLREACEASGPRTVVFAIGGTIELHTPIYIRNPFITILGQTSPANSGGITLKNDGNLASSPVVVRAGEVILRYLRFRPGPSNFKTKTLDGITLGHPTAQVRNVIVDHCSVSWGLDELINVWYNTRDITVQWCIFSESLHCSNHVSGCIGKGPHLGNADGGRISFHHNLMAHNVERNPLITTGTDYPVQVINNLNYNCSNNTMPKSSYGSSPRIDIVGNHYIPGYQTKITNYEVQAYLNPGESPPSFFVEGNIGWRRQSNSVPEMLVVHPGSREWILDSRQAFPSITVAETEAFLAYQDVLSKAGSRIPNLDSVDDRILASVKNRTGRIIDSPSQVGGWPSLAEGTPLPDRDNDGLPDIFEDRYGGELNPSADSGDGYTWIEKWSHELVGDSSVLPTDFDYSSYDELTQTGTLGRQITNGTKDGFAVDGGGFTPDFDSGRSALFAGDMLPSEYDWRSWMLFDNIPLDSTMRVEDARIEVWGKGNNGSVVNLEIVGLMGSQIPQNKEDLDARPTTGGINLVLLNDSLPPSNAWYKLPVDISPILNEILAGDFVKGDSILLLVRDSVKGYSGVAGRMNFASADDYEHGPRLTMEFGPSVVSRYSYPPVTTSVGVGLRNGVSSAMGW